MQRNLVYVVGLALELCYEDLLKTDKYFGGFGKIIKVEIFLTPLYLLGLLVPHCMIVIISLAC